MQTKNEEKKKESLKRYAKLRGSWNGISPVSRIKKSGKIYDRKKTKLPTAAIRNNLKRGKAALLFISHINQE